ncbi:MAG: tyrosine-type recombinase/integrase, partial [Parvularcula sp.]|nr:tyrosine-type recombinase/integrase [Parvularcula sp.]
KSSKPAKTKPLSPVYDETRKRWRLSVPAKVSPDGTRQRRYFETKKQAELEAFRLTGDRSRLGTEATRLNGQQAGDAVKALSILEPTGASLTEAAKAYLKTWQARQASKTFAEAWQVREREMEGLSASHRRTTETVGRRLCGRLGKVKLSDLTHGQLRDVLQAEYPTPHSFNLALRTAGPVFTMAVREGWASENIAKRIQKMNTGRHEITILSLNECRKLLTCARDYRAREDLPAFLRVDASRSTAALALMLFSGIRPGGEITRLDWNDIDVEAGTVFVSNRKSKVDRSRFFNMPSTLRAWLETIPPEQRQGDIVPPNWNKVWKVIRREAGIAHSGQDQLRKTFASAHLQHFGDVNATRSIMGHEAGDVLFTNYRGLMRPADAAAFWQILPGASEGLRVVG